MEMSWDCKNVCNSISIARFLKNNSRIHALGEAQYPGEN